MHSPEEAITTSQLMEYFNRQPRIGTISTARKDGKVDVAVMGSPRMTDEKTVVPGSGWNRTLSRTSKRTRTRPISSWSRGHPRWTGRGSGCT